MQPGQAEGQVTVMVAADHAGPDGDLYQLLGVPREASREEIAQAWRRRARDEHPDARPAVGMLGPGLAPPGLRDLLPRGAPGHAEQLVMIRVRTAVIRSGHDRHLPARRA